MSYKDTTVTPNKTHYYRVRAYRIVNGKRIYGSFSTVKSGKSMFTQVTGVKVNAKDYTTLNLSWKKVSGATKYQIFYSTSKNSGYKGLATVTSNSYSWKKPNCGTTYYFMIRAVKVEKGKNIYGTYCTAASGKTTIGKPTASAAKKNYSSERFPRDVLKVQWRPSFSRTYHPTQKPVSLCEYFIKTYSNKGDIILDPFIGSGTTAVAAINTERKYIGFEKDDKYFKIAKNRLDKLTNINIE